MVGARVHRVEQRRRRQAALQGPLPAAPAGGARVLRPASGRIAARASGAGGALRDPWFLLLPLLVFRAPVARSAIGRDARLRRSGTSLLPVLGKRILVAHMERTRPRSPNQAGVFGYRPQGAYRLAGGSLRRPPVHLYRRQAGVPGLPPREHPGRGQGHRRMEVLLRRQAICRAVLLRGDDGIFERRRSRAHRFRVRCGCRFPTQQNLLSRCQQHGRASGLTGAQVAACSLV